MDCKHLRIKMTKYDTFVYTAYYAYTSYNKLSDSHAKSIASGNYNDIPDVIETGLGDIDIADDIYMIEAYENPGKLWSHCKKSDWYTHVASGIKVKKEVKKSSNYDKPNGDGTCETTLTVKIPVPDGRGKNPNSHNNKPKIDGTSRQIKLSEEEWEILKTLGEGKGYSQGIRNLLK
jgi:hypothetical protein